MTTRERLKALQKFLFNQLCESRKMKAPSENGDVTQIQMVQPPCFIGWAPTRKDASATYNDIVSAVPSITIMPNAGYAKAVEEKRFDRYNHINREEKLGQQLNISILFSVYDPGIRKEGFPGNLPDGSVDMTLLEESTEQGLFTLTDWMDECVQKMLGIRIIPESDLMLVEESLTYGLYSDQEYIVDKRPLFYGFVNAKFNCYAEEKENKGVEELLK